MINATIDKTRPVINFWRRASSKCLIYRITSPFNIKRHYFLDLFQDEGGFYWMADSGLVSSTFVSQEEAVIALRQGEIIWS